MTVNIALFDDLDAVAADAGGALDRAGQRRLFDRLDWFRLLHAHCPPPGRLLVVRAATEPGDQGGARAWLFLARLGRAATSYASWYSLRAGISHSGADRAEAAGLDEALARGLRRAGVARVEIGPDREDRIADGASAFRRAGWIAFRRRDKAVWRAPVGDRDFASYWGERPARLRNTFKRKARSAGLDIRIHDRFSAEAWAEYEAVYRASWKPEEGSFPFLRALAEHEGEAGALRLGIASQSGRPVAAQLWLVENGEATIHKLAYSEDAKAMSPGTILGEAMFRHAIDRDRVRLIDYGVGDEGYKADWMTERDTLWRLLAFDPRTPRGLLGAARALVGRLRSG